MTSGEISGNNFLFIVWRCLGVDSEGYSEWIEWRCLVEVVFGEITVISTNTWSNCIVSTESPHQEDLYFSIIIAIVRISLCIDIVAIAMAIQ